MKKIILSLSFFLGVVSLSAQDLSQYLKSIQLYEPSEENPFGKINPAAPEELKQFDFMVGICDCIDSIPQPNNKWVSFPSIWRAKYFLNGYGIQDNNFNPQNPTTNLRLYDKATKEWKVTYISAAQSYYAGLWEGKKEGDDIIVYQKRGDGQPYSKLSFYNISEDGYDWKSETVHPNGDVNLGWNKKCKKRK